MTVKVMEDKEFGNANLDISIDRFNDSGFAYGDSVDVSFSGGYTLEDIPYYNGYYARLNRPQLVAYPGTEHVAAAISSGGRMWDEAGCRENDTVTVRLNAAGKYLKEQDAMDLVYSDDRADYPDDESFANFRAMSGGKLSRDLFYRGASPVDNSHNRAPFADSLIEKAGVGYVLDLADTEEKLVGYTKKEDFKSEYSMGLLQAGDIRPLGLSAGYQTEDFRKKLADGLKDMTGHEGPYYIHCTEGKDRTGFVCLLLEALAGASYEEIESDYMITYKNYYGLTKESDREKYDTVIKVRLEDMLITLTGQPEGADFSDVDFCAGAQNYLKDCGMTEDEIEKLGRCLILRNKFK